MKPNARRLMTVFLLIMFVGSFVMVARQIMESRQAEEVQNRAEELAKLHIPEEPEPVLEEEATGVMEDTGEIAEAEPLYTDAVADALNEMDLEALQAENPDILGWIMIPDTQISYPVLQGEDNEYYLNHTWEHTKAHAGSIFLEKLCSRNLLDYNTIIYGHRMKNRTMFGSLAYYQNEEYLKEHPYIYIADNTGCRIYEIYSVYEAKIDDPVYQAGTFDDEARKQFIDWTMKKSVIDTGVVPETDRRIVTLSTCTGTNSSERRWVVQGVLKGVAPRDTENAE